MNFLFFCFAWAVDMKRVPRSFFSKLAVEMGVWLLQDLGGKRRQPCMILTTYPSNVLTSRKIWTLTLSPRCFRGITGLLLLLPYHTQMLIRFQRNDKVCMLGSPSLKSLLLWTICKSPGLTITDASIYTDTATGKPDISKTTNEL